MKHLLLLATLLLASFSTALADTPAKIAEDYRKAAEAALTKVNGMLENATTPLIAKLISSGDSAGAEQLTTQLKARLAGEPVPMPQASAKLLFAQYDQARAKALEPVQKACFSRIDSLLKSTSTPSLETVTELGRLRAEIEAGKVENESPLPVEWIYKRTPSDRDEAKILLNAGGRFLIDNGSIKKTGAWRRSADKSGITVQLEDGEKWTVEITDGIGKIQCTAGIRYMVAK